MQCNVAAHSWHAHLRAVREGVAGVGSVSMIEVVWLGSKGIKPAAPRLLTF